MMAVNIKALVLLVFAALCVASPITSDSEASNDINDSPNYSNGPSEDFESSGYSISGTTSFQWNGNSTESENADEDLEDSDLPDTYDFDGDSDETDLPDRYDFFEEEDSDLPDASIIKKKLINLIPGIKLTDSGDDIELKTNPPNTRNIKPDDDLDDETDTYKTEYEDSDDLNPTEVPTYTNPMTSDSSSEEDEQLENNEDEEEDRVISSTTPKQSEARTENEKSSEIVNDPEIPIDDDASEKLSEAIKSEQSSNITQPGGFEFLNMTAYFQFSKGMSRRLLVRRIEKELSHFEDLNDQLTDVIENILDYMRNESVQNPELSFSIFSNVGFGKNAKALCVYYKKREDGRYNFKRLRLSGSFKLAATLVITRTFNSTNLETKDVISYIPRQGATKQDVKEMFKIMVPQLGKLLGKFLPNNDEKKIVYN